MKNSRPSPAATGGAVLLAFALAACGNDAAIDAAAPGTEDAPTATASASSDATAAAASQPGKKEAPASCGTLSLDEGTTMSGEDLAACMVDYLAFAGSGASRMTSETASSSMVWRMKDGYEAYSELDSGIRMILTGETAWIDFGDTGWIKVDPSTPGMEMAFAMVEAWRKATAPELARAMIAAAPVWEVGPTSDVTLPDGTSRNLARVSAAAPYPWVGATVEAMTFWMEEPGKSILQEATVGAAGFTATSTTHYTQWGGEVEIPDPAS